MSDPRTEAAAKALFEIFGSKSGRTDLQAGHLLRARQILAAADEADRAAGVVRVKIDNDLLLALARAALSDGFSAFASVLRQSVEGRSE